MGPLGNVQMGCLLLLYLLFLFLLRGEKSWDFDTFLVDSSLKAEDDPRRP